MAPVRAIVSFFARGVVINQAVATAVALVMMAGGARLWPSAMAATVISQCIGLLCEISILVLDRRRERQSSVLGLVIDIVVFCTCGVIGATAAGYLLGLPAHPLQWATGAVIAIFVGISQHAAEDRQGVARRHEARTPRARTGGGTAETREVRGRAGRAAQPDRSTLSVQHAQLDRRADSRGSRARRGRDAPVVVAAAICLADTSAAAGVARRRSGDGAPVPRHRTPTPWRSAHGGDRRAQRVGEHGRPAAAAAAARGERGQTWHRTVGRRWHGADSGVESDARPAHRRQQLRTGPGTGVPAPARVSRTCASGFRRCTVRGRP